MTLLKKTKKNGCRKQPFFEKQTETILSFGELEALTSTRLTRLLTLFHPRIASEQPFRLQRCTELLVHLDQSASHRQTNCTRLPRNATPVSKDSEIILVQLLHHFQRLQDRVLKNRRLEVVIKRTPVDRDAP